MGKTEFLWTTSTDDMIESAWGIIANAGQGDWTRESEDWQEAAAAWRDRFHRFLDENPDKLRHPEQEVGQ